MSHEIDMSNNRANIAYVGDEPWHTLGHRLTPDASEEEWTEQSGLNFKVERAPVEFTDRQGKRHKHPDRDVLFRNDTGHPLGIMSKGYKVVQPVDIMHNLAKMARAGGFQLETAGSLRGGSKVWALAKVGKAVSVLKDDAVLPYLLLATSFDGSLSTTGKFTSIRVVCRNTITAAIEAEEGGRTVRVPHHATFNPDNVQAQLGIAVKAWDAWIVNARAMAQRSLDGQAVDTFLTELLRRPQVEDEDMRESTGYRNIMTLFEGGAKGSDLTGGRSMWQMLNAVTEYVDHHKGKTRDNRLNSAWFGAGDAMKNRAYQLLLAD